MERVARIFRSHLSNAKKNLENILDQDSWAGGESFELSQDYISLQNSLKSLPKDRSEKIMTVFGNLNPYFSSGLFLYRKNINSHEWNLGSAFRNGKFRSLDSVLSQSSSKFPNMKNGTLIKTTPYQILKPLGLCSWCDGTDSSAFVLKFDDSFVGVFFLDLPEPWLRLHIEKIYNTVANVLELKRG